MRSTESERDESTGRGGAVDAAIEHGIDVSLLERNLRMTPAQRIAQLNRLNRFTADVQQRTVPQRIRTELAQRRLRQKLADLGPER